MIILDIAIMALGFAIPVGIFITSSLVQARYYQRRQLGWNWLLSFAYAMPTWALIVGALALGWAIAFITAP